MCRKTRPAHRLAGVHNRRALRILRAVDLAEALLESRFEYPAKRYSRCALRVGAHYLHEPTGVFSKLLNNFKKLANAFLFCQGNSPHGVDVVEAAAESHGAGGRFLDFHYA